MIGRHLLADGRGAEVERLGTGAVALGLDIDRSGVPAAGEFGQEVEGTGQRMVGRNRHQGGQVQPAEEALQGRLVRSIHKADELLPAAYALAREIADNTAPVSVALNRQMIWKMLGADHPMEAHKVDSKGIYERGKSADVKEGVIAFLEKRPAKFPMKVSSGMPSYFPWWKERTFK